MLGPQVAGLAAGPARRGRRWPPCAPGCAPSPRPTTRWSAQREALEFWEVVVDAADSIVFRLMFNSLRAAYEPTLEALAAVMSEEVEQLGTYEQIVHAIAAGDEKAATRHAQDLLGPATRGLLDAIGLLDAADPDEAVTADRPGGDPMTTLEARPRRGVTLTETGREFWRHPSPWLIAAVLVGSTAARVAVGDWRWSDLLAPLVFVALFPVLEWLVHVFVLHWRPRRVGARHPRHPAGAQAPRAPRRPAGHPAGLHPVADDGGPRRGRPGAARCCVFPRPGQALAFSMTVGLAGLVYEWTHYLIHSDYKPRSRAYRAVYRHHRLHHFKNENYWLTVTTAHTADRIFGTAPDPPTVPTSPTAKNLHGIG